MSLLNLFKRKKSDQNILVNDQSESKMAQFVRDSKKNKIGIKSALMEYSAIERGLDVERINKRMLYAKNKQGDALAFMHMNGMNSSRIGMHICDNKIHTRNILKKNNITVVKSKNFKYNEFAKAIAFLNEINAPVVIKPISLSRGRGISTNITTEEELKIGWDKAFNAYKTNKESKTVLIEQQFDGYDYRVFVVNDKVISVTQRRRANVVGNGKSTILELINEKNEERKQNPYLCDYLIPTNIEVLDQLIKQNLTLNYVPKQGQLVTLRSQSNISTGGDSIDYTDTIHPEFKEIAIKTLKAIPGMDYAGIDFIAKDITKKPTKNNFILSEVEFSPAPLSQFPYKGRSYDLSGAIIDHYLRNIEKK